jgi:hypothetical protein
VPVIGDSARLFKPLRADVLQIRHPTVMVVRAWAIVVMKIIARTGARMYRFDTSGLSGRSNQSSRD